LPRGARTTLGPATGEGFAFMGSEITPAAT